MVTTAAASVPLQLLNILAHFQVVTLGAAGGLGSQKNSQCMCIDGQHPVLPDVGRLSTRT